MPLENLIYIWEKQTSNKWLIPILIEHMHVMHYKVHDMFMTIYWLHVPVAGIMMRAYLCHQAEVWHRLYFGKSKASKYTENTDWY